MEDIPFLTSSEAIVSFEIERKQQYNSLQIKTHQNNSEYDAIIHDTTKHISTGLVMNMLERLHFETREEWLNGRQMGLGASDASAVVGLNPWTTTLSLWKQKIGSARAPDLSENVAVQQGVKMEPILRDYYIATHPQYTLEYFPYDILRQSERPHITATLDGELADSDGRKGILEIKNVNIGNKAALEKWTGGNLPDQYYVQLIAQLAATGFRFARLFAALHFMNGDVTLKEIEVERDDVLDDIAWLIERLDHFWNNNIIGGAMPGMPLTL